MTINLNGLLRAAFLDRHGRFAKVEDDVAIVRLFYGEDCEPVDITLEDFNVLSEADKTTIEQAGSGAGCVDTAHKSNA